MGLGIIVINVNIKRHTRVPLRHKLTQSIIKNLRNALNLFMTVNDIIVINVNTIANKRVLLRNTLNLSIMGTDIIIPLLGRNVIVTGGSFLFYVGAYPSLGGN